MPVQSWMSSGQDPRRPLLILSLPGVFKEGSPQTSGEHLVSERGTFHALTSHVALPATEREWEVLNMKAEITHSSSDRTTRV